MPNNVLKIRHKIFQKKMMGYDCEEVSLFLKQVAQDVESLIKERNFLKEKLQENESLVEDFSKKDEILQKSITNATEMAERIKQEAIKKAQETLESARKKSQMILEEGERELQRYQKEFLSLKKVKIDFEKNFRRLLYDYMTSLDEKPQNPHTHSQNETPLSPPPTNSPFQDTKENEPSHKAKQKVTEVLDELLKDVNLFKT